MPLEMNDVEAQIEAFVPDHLLEGSGNQVRSIRLSSSRDLECPEVLSMIAQALAPGRSAFSAAPVLRTVVKSVSDKQRPRRPAGA